MKIGYIGLGLMGSGMAANIIKAGYSLTVYDIRPEAVKSFVEKGASSADTPKAVAESSEIVFTSLPGPKEVEEVALGKNGIIEGVHPGLIYVDLTTNSPALVRRLYQVFKEKGVPVMDAPVSGGPEGARTGRMSLMVGGDEPVYHKIKPVLDAMGDKPSYTGDIGTGSICKLMHNCIGATINIVAGEVLTTGVKAGVKPEVLLRAIREGNAGSGVSPFRRLLPKTYLRGQFDQPSFALGLLFKDVDLATTVGREFDVPMAICNMVRQEYLSAINRGWREKDSTITLLLQEERAGGIEVRVPDAEIE
jgi:3-hydroxyisobutyrate dehydrogenase